MAQSWSIWDGYDGFQIHYPLVNKQKAMENGPFIDGLPIKHGDFL